MTNYVNEYGYKLTEKEYQHQIMEALKRHDTSSREGMEEFNKVELNITIDHRLGVNYPQEKRKLMQDLRDKSHNHLVKLVILYKLGNVLPNALQEKVLNIVIKKMLGNATAFMSKKEIKEMFLD